MFIYGRHVFLITVNYSNMMAIRTFEVGVTLTPLRVEA
jgi:hypothetical protein